MPVKPMKPLTPEECDFAIKNHHLIRKYLNIRGLPFDDWYDIVVFRYLRSVKRWFAEPDLHKHKFETIAYYAMWSAIGHEYERQSRRAQTVSLDKVLPGTKNLTLIDILPSPYNLEQHVETRTSASNLCAAHKRHSTNTPNPGGKLCRHLTH